MNSRIVRYFLFPQKGKQALPKKVSLTPSTTKEGLMQELLPQS
ncbi:hypothetical protein PORCAN_2083 [Porphyromonas crevioricanis JCM 13913]|nr:hypothetical protein PORCAN_2083 [Porphyromonas crevioricanis JCM 13913]